MAAPIAGNVDRTADAGGQMLPPAGDTDCARSDPRGTETTGAMMRHRLTVLHADREEKSAL
ncbi:hypothetical protein [Acetobacter persici]|nr:hypothetical protein [Acetobacter persici]MBS0962405.1 hypothetical protein [Acetobacter persici]MBS1014743.1 hypothetical protein [Acetobacter persici]OUI91804.1 hypothetical protein HK19_04315 [Acetobacter persici]